MAAGEGGLGDALLRNHKVRSELPNTGFLSSLNLSLIAPHHHPLPLPYPHTSQLLQVPFLLEVRQLFLSMYIGSCKYGFKIDQTCHGSWCYRQYTEFGQTPFTLHAHQLFFTCICAHIYQIKKNSHLSNTKHIINTSLDDGCNNYKLKVSALSVRAAKSSGVHGTVRFLLSHDESTEKQKAQGWTLY